MRGGPAKRGRSLDNVPKRIVKTLWHSPKMVKNGEKG